MFSESRGDVNKPWKLKKRNAGKELRRDCTDSSGRVGLCAPSLPSRVGTSLLRAKQGAAPAMGLIPLVCEGGGVRMETVHNIQLHGAFKGSSREGRQQPWQSQTVELLWEEQECLKTRAKVQLGILHFRKYFTTVLDLSYTLENNRYFPET